MMEKQVKHFGIGRYHCQIIDFKIVQIKVFI